MFIKFNKLFISRYAILLAFSALLLTACVSQRDITVTPVSSETQTQSLAGKWSFKIDPYNLGVEQKWWEVALDAEHWDQIDVPGVWDVYDRYHDYTGTAWYRYQFDTESYSEEQLIELVFDSVYHDSEVWLNGQYLGANNLGFMAFKFDVTEYLNASSSNTLVVKVNNRVKRGAVWNWGGIRFPVYLKIVPQTNIEHAHVTAVPDLALGNAEILVKTQINHSDAGLDNAKVKLDILRDERVIYSNIVTASTKDKDNSNASNFIDTFTLNKEDVDLWHFNHPNLYHVRATLMIDGDVKHTLNDRFGIRKIALKDNGLYLNGERIRLNGFNMVPEDRFDGNALPLTRIKEDVDLLKTLNGNFARLSGPALPKPYLDYLDEVGFLLIEEVGLWGKDALVDPDHPLPKEWLKRLVNDHYNHPSIIGWSVGNEIGDLQKNPKALEYVEGAIEHSKRLDPERLAVYISYSADYQRDDPTQFSDIVMFNKYNDHEERLKVVHDFHPDKGIFFSEIGTNLDGVDPNESTLDPQALWNGLKKYPYLIGTSHFAFSDYRSDWNDEKDSWTTDLSENRAWGVLTSYRQPKRSFDKIRNFNAPVEELKIIDGDSQTVSLEITPKSTNTFPAFTLHDYRILWVAKGKGGAIISADSKRLPEIKPGDQVLSMNVKIDEPFDKLSTYLLDPFGYIVKQQDLFKSAPDAPKVTAVYSSLDTFRVSFEHSDLAEEYTLIAVNDAGEILEGKPTINEFAEIENIEPDKNYQLQLVASNQYGRSTPTIASENMITKPDELPPIIWSVFAKQDAFHIGFSVTRNDFKYEIQYGLAPGEYSRQFLIDTHGATRIPAIKPGKKHFFRMKRLITGSIDSEWTAEYEVALLGENGIEAPNDAVAISTNEGVVLMLNPVQGAIGYRLRWMEEGKPKTLDTKLAYSTFITVNNVSLLNAQNIEIASIDVNSQVAEYSDVRLISNK